MAESSGESNPEGSHQLLYHYCEPCFAASTGYEVKPVVGHCINCDQNLCMECFTTHHELKLFKSQSARPNLKTTTINGFINKVRELMPTVVFIAVVIFLTSYLNFQTEEMSKLVKNIEDSQDLRNLKDVVNDVKKLRDEFVDLKTKAEKQADTNKRGFTKIENILMEQIKKLTVQLETLKENEI